MSETTGLDIAIENLTKLLNGLEALEYCLNVEYTITDDNGNRLRCENEILYACNDGDTNTYCDQSQDSLSNMANDCANYFIECLGGDSTA